LLSVPYISETDSPPVEHTLTLNSANRTTRDSVNDDTMIRQDQKRQLNNPQTDLLNTLDDNGRTQPECRPKSCLKPRKEIVNGSVYYSANADTTIPETGDPGGVLVANTTANKGTFRNVHNKFLVLFSGTDSVGETLRKLYPNCTVVNVDLDVSAPKVTHCVDVMKWEYWKDYKPGEFDVIWASPPCTAFSNTCNLNTSPEQQISHQEKLELGCKVVKRTIEIIQYFSPKEYFIENPVGKLRDQPFMSHLNATRSTTSYCMFGTPFRKNTDIWASNLLQLPRCSARLGTLCDNRRRLGLHPQRATQGSMWGHPGSTLQELNRIPEGLVRALFKKIIQPTAYVVSADVQSSTDLLDAIQARVDSLEALDESERNDSKGHLNALPLVDKVFEGKSLFQATKNSQPRVMTFSLDLSQNGKKVTKASVMLDSGSTFDIISKSTADNYGFELSALDKSIPVTLADGTKKMITEQCEAMINFNGTVKTFKLLVLDIAGFDVILGMCFLGEHDPDISWSQRYFCFRDKNKTKVWAQQAREARQPLKPLVATISGKDFQDVEDKWAAHLITVEKYQDMCNNDNNILTYPNILLSGQALIALLMPCSKNGSDENSEHPLAAVPKDEHLDPSEAMKGKGRNDKAQELSFDDFITSLKPKTDENAHLTKQNCDRLIDILKELKPIFDEPTGLPAKRDVVHRIVELPNTVPPCANAYRMSPVELKELKKQLDFLLAHGYIRPSSSPYGAPVLFAPKKDGKLRLCLDFRGLNNQTVKDKYPLPRDQDIFDQLQGAKYFTSLDALYGYWQIRIADEDVHKTSIRTPLGSYEFLVMPFGLTNAPATFQRFMEAVLREHLLQYCMVYIDDIIIYSKTEEEHLKHIEAVLRTLMKHQVCIKLQKCQFFQTRLHFLGHVVSAQGIAPDPMKIKALVDWPIPTNVTQVQAFVGLGNYYRRHVKMFAEIIAPLTSLSLEIPFKDQWNAECSTAFNKAKEYLTSSEVLALPDTSLPYIVRTDASDYAIGGSLHQVQDGEERVIAYESRKLSATARNWPTHERELFAYFHCFQAWRHYLHGAQVTAQGDHKPLLHIKTQKSITPKQARWLSFLDTFDMKLDYLPGKMNVGPDGLSRRPDHLPPVMSLLNNKYFGRSLDEYCMMISFLNISPLEKDRYNSLVRKGRLRLFSIGAAPDPDFVVNPEQHSVARNGYDDTELLGDPALNVTSALITLLKEATKVDTMYKLFRSNKLSPQLMQHYDVLDGILFYKKIATDRASSRIYVPSDLALRNKIIYEYHDAPIQGHFGRVKTLERISRHFYWPNMDQSVDEYIKSCDRCQRFKYRTHRPASTTESHKIPDYPWQIMSLDEKSGLPLTKSGHDAVWVFADKLSRRAHFAAVKHKLTSPQIAKLFMDIVFKHHGIPEVIISDRDSLFTAAFWDTLWKLVGTNLNMSTTNNPQTDAQSERLIKTLVELISNYAAANPDDWDEYLPALEFAYNDSVHATTGFSPFELDMGRTPNSPIKLVAHSLLSRQKYYTVDEMGINPRHFLDRLSRNIATARQRIYKMQLVQKHRLEANTVPLTFRPGDKVYMEHPDLYTPKHKSMDPNYIGPFRVIREVAKGVYELDLPFEHRFRHPVINVRKLKPAYERKHISFNSDIHINDDSEQGTGPIEVAQPPHMSHAEVALQRTNAQTRSTESADVVETTPTTELAQDERQEHKTGAEGGDQQENPNELPTQQQDRPRRDPPRRDTTDPIDAIEVLELDVKPKPREPNTMQAVVRLSNKLVGKGGWCTVKLAIQKFRYWYTIHDYIQNHQQDCDREDKIFTLVTKTFKGTRFLGYIIEAAPTEEFPFVVIYQDGDVENYTTTELDELLTDTIAFCNPIRRINFNNITIDYTYWVFPRRLAQIYARLTRPYQVDAFEHHLGRSSKAPRFFSRANTVFRHRLNGLSVWANPPFDSIGEFLKYFLKHYEEDTTKTSLMLVVPLWLTKPWWPLLRRFRVMDVLPIGSHLFTSPLWEQEEILVHKGPTQWITLVLYIGAEFHSDRLWRSTKDSSSTEYSRLQCVQKRNLLLSGDVNIDGPAIYYIIDQIHKIVDRHGPFWY